MPIRKGFYEGHFDVTFKLVAADATSDGNQYSKAITAPAGGSSGSPTTLFEATLTPSIKGTLFWAYFLIIVNLAESGINGDIYWRPQVKNHDGDNWVSLADWQKIAADASSAADYRLEGEISWSPLAAYQNLTDTNFLTRLTKVPMDFRVTFYTDHATETAEGKLKSGSQVRVVGKTS